MTLTPFEQGQMSLGYDLTEAKHGDFFGRVCVEHRGGTETGICTMDEPTQTDDRTAKLASARAVGEATLYEGYVLYPYRASSLKNSLSVATRWQFGVIAPGAELATDVVLAASPGATIGATIRFLRPQAAREGEDHAIDDEWPLDPVLLGESTTGRVRQQTAQLTATVDWHTVDAHTVVRLTIGNEPASEGSIVGVHAVLWVDGGTFVSVIDPPDAASAAVATTRNQGLYPVLVGSLTGSDVALALPIILYDDPQLAGESPHALYDATEIDEILSLRVLTLTDDEKRLARSTDPRSAAIIDHVMGLQPDDWLALHGTERSEPAHGMPGADADPLSEAADARFDPFTDTVVVNGRTIASGSRVLLRPTRSSDIHDMFLAGLAATVRGVFTDVAGDVMVAVTIDDDPGADLHLDSGRFRYFHCDEIEVAGP